MFKVYFDYGSVTDLVATFNDEKTYMICFPHLEVYAKQLGAEVVDSMETNAQCIIDVPCP